MNKKVVFGAITGFVCVLIVVIFLIVKPSDEKISVKFMVDGQQYDYKTDLEIGALINEPTPPTKEDYKFIGWYINGESFNFKTEIKENMILEAKFEKKEKDKVKYTITFNIDGGSLITKQVVEENGLVSKPSNPTRNGYIFVGWYLNEQEYNFENKVISDITLVAKWNKVKEEESKPVEVKKYTITFNTDGGSYINKQTINQNQKVTKPSNPTKSGYTFIGWYLNGKLFDFNTKITSDLTLIAKWEKEITTVKQVIENVDVQYTNINENEINMLRGTTRVVQNGVVGVKTITYNVTYDAKGIEMKREKVSEVVTKQPINQITKVGVSDYNLNTDTISYNQYGVYCLDKDLKDFGTGIFSCAGTFEGYFNSITLNNIEYLHSYSIGDAYGENAVFKNVRPLIKLNVNVAGPGYTGSLNGTTYNFQYLMGGDASKKLLSEEECNKFNLSCGRW